MEMKMGWDTTKFESSDMNSLQSHSGGTTPKAFSGSHHAMLTLAKVVRHRGIPALRAVEDILLTNNVASAASCRWVTLAQDYYRSTLRLLTGSQMESCSL